MRVAAAGEAQLPCKLLVVDDSPLVRDSAAALLESEGYEVRTAAGGIEALAVVASWRPRIVLLDMHMPHLNGIETVRRLRLAHPGDAPAVVLMSGVTLDAAWRNHAREAGFDECIDKAADPEIWLAVLARLREAVEPA